VGAIPGAMPPVIGWTAAANSLSLGAVLLFSIVFFWQLPHFASIAWRYRKEYGGAGYRMLPVVDQDGTWLPLHLITHTVGLLMVSLIPVTAGLAGSTYGIAAMLLGVSFLAFGVAFVRHRTPAFARMHTLASVIYLPVLLVILLCDKIA